MCGLFEFEWQVGAYTYRSLLYELSCKFITSPSMEEITGSMVNGQPQD